ncbi:MAG: hypothetical protein AAFW70_18935 [Cyanobacteria bacterium J06635_10]
MKNYSPNKNRLLELEQFIHSQRKTVAKKQRPKTTSSKGKTQYSQISSKLNSPNPSPGKSPRKSSQPKKWDRLAHNLGRNRKVRKIHASEELPEINFSPLSPPPKPSVKPSISPKPNQAIAKKTPPLLPPAPKLSEAKQETPQSWQEMASSLKRRKKSRKKSLVQEQSLILNNSSVVKEVGKRRNRETGRGNNRNGINRQPKQDNEPGEQEINLIETQHFDSNEPIEMSFKSIYEAEIVPSIEIEIEPFETVIEDQLTIDIVEAEYVDNSVPVTVEIIENKTFVPTLEDSLEIDILPSENLNLLPESVEQAIDKSQKSWNWFAKLKHISQLFLWTLKLKLVLMFSKKNINSLNILLLISCTTIVKLQSPP